MKIKPAKESAIYPEFHLENLERYAVRWAKYLNGKHEHIRVDSIFLCRINTEFEERIRSRLHKQWDTTKYAVVVEIIGCDIVDVKSVEFYPHENADESDKELRPEENYSDCQNFIAMVKFAGHYSAKHPFIDDAFKRSVYRGKAPNDFTREWRFFPKNKKSHLKHLLSDGKTPWIHLDTAYVLYDAKQLPDVVLRIIKKAGPEIESLYDDLKKNFDGSLSNANHHTLQKAALDAFDNRNNSFKLVKKSYLLQEELYFLTGGKEKRSFLGKLLISVVDGQKSGRFAASKLWKAYMKITKES